MASDFVTLYTVIEVACFIISVICLIKDQEFNWRIVTVFLFITCIVEIGTIPMIKLFNKTSTVTDSNQWVYNILLLLQMAFYMLMFESLFNKYINGQIAVIIGIILFSCSYLYEIFISNEHGLFDYNSMTNTVLSVLVIIYSLYYYYLILKDENYIALKYSPGFWWVTGILFFYYGNIVCTVFWNVLKSPRYNRGVHYSYIINTLIIILYTCWSYSFICRKWLSKYA